MENIGYWIKENEANERHFYDGTYWTFNSRRAYKELFPYLSERQIDTAFRKLIDDGVLITGNYNKLAYDRTLWYALTQKGKCILHFDGMDCVEMSNGFSSNVSPIPDVNPVVNASVNPNNKDKKQKYGEYKNVLLSDGDMDKLKSEFPRDWKQRIERLSEYMASKGAKYKDHLATIRSWARKEKEQRNSQATGNGQYYMPNQTSANDDSEDFMKMLFPEGVE